MLEELVVQHRPDQCPHQLDRPVDQIGLVDAVDQHENAVEVHRSQNALEFAQQFVAVVGALPGGHRLADELPAGDVQQHPAEQLRAAAQDPRVAGDLPCPPPPSQQPPKHGAQPAAISR